MDTTTQTLWPAAAIDTDVEAVLFDLDGVLTPTADLHRQSWIEVLSAVASQFDVDECTDADYFRLIDGKPRAAGVAAFLADRGLDLPAGEPGTEASTLTREGIAQAKNDVMLARIADGVKPYRDALDLLDRLGAADVPLAVVSSSRNAKLVLDSARLISRFVFVIDGVVAGARGIPGKPAPDTYLYAASLLLADPSRTVVVEDAESGVAAGRAGGFRTIGVDRGAGASQLLAAGAHVTVDSLTDVKVAQR